MFARQGMTRLMATGAAALLALGVGATAIAGPASAGAGSVVLTATGGSSPGSVYVTMTTSLAPYAVVVYTSPVKSLATFVKAQTGADPAGTEVTGLTPGETYWVFAGYDGDLISTNGMQVTATAAGPSMWMQAYDRRIQAALCEAGWNPSYAQWPNGNRGGWTCDRFVRMYG